MDGIAEDQYKYELLNVTSTYKNKSDAWKENEVQRAQRKGQEC